MGRKNCAVIMLTSACLFLTACALNELPPSRMAQSHQNQMEGVAKQELTEFDTGCSENSILSDLSGG